LMAGKGDTPRPVNRARYDEGYERIFGTDDEVARRRRASMGKVRGERGSAVVMDDFAFVDGSMAADMEEIELAVAKGLRLPIQFLVGDDGDVRTSKEEKL